MRTSTRAAIALLLISALVGLGGATASAENEGNVEICHRTNSNANPYVTPPPNQSGQNGGTDHFIEHTGPLWNPDLKKAHIEWGDIIPPSADHPLGSEAYQALAATQAWQDFVNGGGTFADFIAGVGGDDCTLPGTPEVPTHDVTLAKATSGGTAPAAGTEFTFTVVCDTEDSVVESPVDIAAGAAAVTVAEDVAEGDECTITETDSKGANSTSFTVNGGAPTVDDSVTFAVGTANVAVVATNTYPEPTVTQTDEPEVLGEVITKAPAQLPRTGAMTPYEAMAGAGFVLAGALALVASRRLTADIES